MASWDPLRVRACVTDESVLTFPPTYSLPPCGNRPPGLAHRSPNSRWGPACGLAGLRLSLRSRSPFRFRIGPLANLRLSSAGLPVRNLYGLSEPLVEGPRRAADHHRRFPWSTLLPAPCGVRALWVGSPGVPALAGSGLRASWLAPFPPLAVTLPFPNWAAGQLAVSRPGFPAEALAASGTPL
jgi:hypothetical protein